jgi:hypothetical protein
MLVVNRFLRVALALFAAQMVGTFLVFLVLPDVAFTEGNPLRLTDEGEFVVKNLVLFTAGLVVGSSLPALDPRPPASADAIVGSAQDRASSG